MTRRVYELSDALLDGVRRFQQQRGLVDEVAAVRLLITAGLQHSETPDGLLARMRGRQAEGASFRDIAGDILATHPRVKAIQFVPSGIVCTLASGETLTLDRQQGAPA